MKNKIEDILENSKDWHQNYDEDPQYSFNMELATQELYNLFIDEQIKLLTELYKSCPTDVVQKSIHELLKNKQLELQKLKQL